MSFLCSFSFVMYELPYFQHVPLCLCLSEEESQSCLCLSAWEDFTTEWEQLLLLRTCRQIAQAAGYQSTSHSKNTLQMTSFCAPTIAPFLQPSALLHLYRNMKLLPAQQSSALPLQLNVAVRNISGGAGSGDAVVFFSQIPLMCSSSCRSKQEH